MHLRMDSLQYFLSRADGWKTHKKNMNKMYL